MASLLIAVCCSTWGEVPRTVDDVGYHGVDGSAVKPLKTYEAMEMTDVGYNKVNSIARMEAPQFHTTYEAMGND